MDLVYDVDDCGSHYLYEWSSMIRIWTDGRIYTLHIILPNKMGDYKGCFLLNSLQEFLERVKWEGCMIPSSPNHKVVDKDTPNFFFY